MIQRDMRLSAGYHPTAQGRVEVENTLARRANRGLRRKYAATSLLRWLDNQDASEAGHRAARENFDAAADGKPFSDQESANAASHLGAEPPHRVHQR